MLGEAFHDYTRYQIYYFFLCRTLEGRRSFPSGSLLEVEFSMSGISEIPNFFVRFAHGGHAFVILFLP